MSSSPRPHSSTSDSSSSIRESRLRFPPSYAVVGIYRLLTDPKLFRPIWDKVRHGAQRGIIIGVGWTILTFKIQRGFVWFFLSNSPRVTGLSNDTIFGYRIPFDIVTYATVMFLSSQVNMILTFFLSRNLRIAADRAWDLTVQSRGKDADFWGPYVEEWQVPPQVVEGGRKWDKWVSNRITSMLIHKVLLAPLHLYPIIGILISSWLKSIGTARYLHRSYFSSKNMTPLQSALFMEERKWEYRAFGFTASLLEGFPIVGLGFRISNRIGAAMWAHDLEKRQHLFASGVLFPLPPRGLPLPHGDEIEMRPQGADIVPTKESEPREGLRARVIDTACGELAGGWNES